MHYLHGYSCRCEHESDSPLVLTNQRVVSEVFELIAEISPRTWHMFSLAHGDFQPHELVRFVR